MKKVIRDEKVAVLYSPGYGAGWYSWNQECPQLLFAPELVKLVEAGKRDGEEFKDVVLKIAPGAYIGGSNQLKIEWVTKGHRFEISEYDGNESVRVFGPDDGFIA